MKPITSCRIEVLPDGKLAISDIKGPYWDMVQTLRALGGRAQKMPEGWVWHIDTERFKANVAKFEALGVKPEHMGATAGEESLELPTKAIVAGPLTDITITRNRNRIHFHFNYSEDLNALFRSAPDFTYNAKEKSRAVTLSGETAPGVQKVVAELKSRGHSINGLECLHDLEKKVKQGFASQEEMEKNREALDRLKTDFSVEVKGLDLLKVEPFGYQKAGIAFLNLSEGRAIIGDEMGLGKTLQALAWVVINKKQAIVVCPKSFIYGWAEEIKKFSSATVQVLSSKKSPLENAQFTIVNYEAVTKYEFKNYDTVIVDESHLIKNKKTQRFKEVKKLASEADHVICLSGTAIVNRPAEFYTQLNLVRAGITGSWDAYTQKYCAAFHDGYGMNVSGASNLDKLVRLVAPIYLRRNKKDVLHDLPAKIRQEIVVQGIQLPDPDDLSDFGILAYLNLMKLEIAKAKTEATIEFAKNMLEQGGKVVIFSDYIEPVKRIGEAFGEEAICYLAQLTPEERAAAQKQFQTDPKKRVFVATSKIASVALTLTASSKVIFNDLPWSPGVLLQAEDRCHRVGAKDTVNVYRMVARGTLDDNVTGLLTKKAEILKAVLEGSGFQPEAQNEGSEEKSILTDLVAIFKVSKKK
jgi:SWI/SNF-related matrix-associated actin-dependent regulator 1 of chromatin subfamily A